MKELQDRVAVVTGASSGIGYAIAESFLREGMRVAIASQNAERLSAGAGEQLLSSASPRWRLGPLRGPSASRCSSASCVSSSRGSDDR